MYTIFFISFVVSSTCFGCYLHTSSGAQLPRTAIGFVWFGVLFRWSRYWFGTPLYLLQWNNTKPYKTYGCTRQLCSWWRVQIAPETCIANYEINKYSVHLVGPELNIYVTEMYGTTNIKFKSRSYQPIWCDISVNLWSQTHSYAKDVVLISNKSSQTRRNGVADSKLWSVTTPKNCSSCFRYTVKPFCQH
jgi:hypothetical protein